MKVKLILPSLIEAQSPFWRPIKYSLFPPIGLATLAGYLDPDDEAQIVDQLKSGYNRAYRDFYTWNAIFEASRFHGTFKHQLKHFFYTAGWKKFEPLWNTIIQLKQLNLMTPLLEGILSKVTQREEPPPALSPTVEFETEFL